LGIFLGFPDDLFNTNQGSFACSDVTDPRFIEFYAPELEEVVNELDIS
jgi:hypothetical protein